MVFWKWRSNNLRGKVVKLDCEIARPANLVLRSQSGHSVPYSMRTALLFTCLAFLSCNQAQKLMVGSFSMRLVHPQNQLILYEALSEDQVDLSGYTLIPMHPAAAEENQPKKCWVSEDELISAADLASVTLIKPRKKKLWTREEYEAYAAGFDSNANVKPTSYEDFLERNRTSWEIGVIFSSSGASKFADVTAQNIDHKLAIVVDGDVLMAPKILEPIHGGEATIRGAFSKEEAKAIIRKIVGE